MDRRTALKKTSGLVLTGLTLSTFSGLFQSCLDTNDLDWKPKILEKNMVSQITEMVKILLPDEEISLAIKKAMPKYIDVVMDIYNTKETQSSFKSSAVEFESLCQKTFNKKFTSCTSEEKLTFLQTEEKRFVTANQPSFFGYIKEYTFQAVLQTETGLRQFLNFNPVPGTYDGCIPFEEIGKIQHSNDSFKI